MGIYNKKSIEEIQFNGKTALVRCDFNVPLKDGVITDDKRIVESLPTIKYLLENGAKVILCSHLGRPKDGFEDKFSLAPVAAHLSKLLGKEVKMSKDVAGDDTKAIAASLNNGESMLIENVRFIKGETKNDPEFSKELADLADIFVNDAFGSAHRAHCSTTGVAAHIPAVCGFLIEKELRIMGEALTSPKRPFVSILGGAKVSDKIGVITNLLNKVDSLLIGGGMAYTFHKAMGHTIGSSLCEEDKLDLAKELIVKAKEKGVKLLLPIDSVVADKFAEDAEAKIIDGCDLPEGYMGLDIGPKTSAMYADVIKSAGTVIWNGPMGVFEFKNFAEGTATVAKAVAESNAISIIGGGDSAAAAVQLGFADRIDHISTGGGAALEFLEGIELPGIACLNDK